MIHRAIHWLACLAFFALTGVQAANAELTWTQKMVEVTGDASLPVLEARFRFTNTGSRPVEIRQVESSCGCTTTALVKRLYAPQESGEIVARYTVGTHTGLQKKTLLVATNDGLPPTTLTLVAHIPEILRIDPSVVTWAHSESTSPKSITLELLQSAPLDGITVESSTPDTKVVLTTLVKGHKYSLSVTPGQTDRFLYSKLTIHCRFKDAEKTFVAYATVRPSTGAH